MQTPDFNSNSNNGIESLTAYDYLPTATKSAFETRKGLEVFHRATTTITIHQNSKITSGVNKLTSLLLGNEHASVTNSKLAVAGGKRKGDGDGKRIIAVVAQGEGIPKALSVVEIAKRSVSVGQTTSAEKGTEETGHDGADKNVNGVEEWFQYVQISSMEVREQRKIKRKDRRNGEGQGRLGVSRESKIIVGNVEMRGLSSGNGVEKENAAAVPDDHDSDEDTDPDSDPAFEDPDTLPPRSRGAQQNISGSVPNTSNTSNPPSRPRTEPVMLFWFSKTSLPEFRDAFAETRVSVKRAVGNGVRKKGLWTAAERKRGRENKGEEVGEGPEKERKVGGDGVGGKKGRKRTRT